MQTLRNEMMTVLLNEWGGLVCMESTGIEILLAQDELRVETDYGLFSTRDALKPEMEEIPNGIVFRCAGAYRLTMEYIIEPGKNYLARPDTIDI
ncbi:MAG: hypothetical protein GX916_10325 [Clostridiales bacterium]|nr:hypothetical protein [Clostridiales bacterium]